MFVCKHGVRDSATFDTKAAAASWALTRGAGISAGKRRQIQRKTVREALQRYAREVSPTNGGARWEKIRLAKFERELPFAGRWLSEVQTTDIAGWRDTALRGVPAEDGTWQRAPILPASIRREMVLLRSVFELARKEWGWLATNPMEGSRGRKAGRRAPGASRTTK